MQIIVSRLTEHGETKIARAIRIATESAQEALKHNMETVVLPMVSKGAPSPDLEKEMLISGDSPRGRIGRHYQAGGADNFIEFNRDNLQDAILNDNVNMRLDGHVIWAETGHTKEINLKTAIYWTRMGKSRTVHRSEPFKHGRLLIPGGRTYMDSGFVQAVEFGGTWLVDSRGDWPLQPEEGVFVDTMVKTVEPCGMYGRILQDTVTLKVMRINIGRYVKDNVRFNLGAI